MKQVIFFLFFCFSIFFNYPINARELVLTIPKTGTNLLLKCTRLIKAQYDDHSKVGWGHQWRASGDDEVSVGPTEKKVSKLENSGTKTLIIIRDPRDLVCALSRVSPKLRGNKIDYILKNPGTTFARVACNNPYWKKFHSYLDLYQEYIKWGNYPFVYVTRFELLIGPKGGGTLDAQLQEIKNIALHIEKPLDDSQARKVAAELWGGTPTFKRGKVKNWKDKFSYKNLQYFNLHNPGLLGILGY